MRMSRIKCVNAFIKIETGSKSKRFEDIALCVTITMLYFIQISRELIVHKKILF